jgi:hypothetical protein
MIQKSTDEERFGAISPTPPQLPQKAAAGQADLSMTR